MFYGSDYGGRTAAILASLIATCKRLGLDPFAYRGPIAPRGGDLPRIKLATEDSAQHLHRQKEAIARVDPALVIGGETNGRNHTMQMGMVIEFLIPGTEHAEEADFGAEMAGIARHFEQRLGTGPEQ